ncbi:MAG: DoxX family protein [Rhizomicrobium sp.]
MGRDHPALKGIPAAPLLLALALIALFLGGLSLVFGFQTRYGAVLLFGFTIVASVSMHDYWLITNPIDRAADFQVFARNMAIAGGLLLVVGLGPGPVAVDSIKPKKR